MQMNIMELIKEGKIGDHLQSRGGPRYRWNRFAFAKVKKNTVSVFNSSSWNTINKDSKAEVLESVATLTPDTITILLPKTKGTHANSINKRWGTPNVSCWEVGAFLSLNLIYNTYVRWSYGANLIHTKDGDIMPFKRMSFDWNGNLVSKIPKSCIKGYEKWNTARKNRINAQSRARYAQEVAEREFKKYDKAGNLDEYPVANIFKIKMHNLDLMQ